MVLFTVAHVSQIRPLDVKLEIVENEEYVKTGIEFIEQLKPFDSSKVEAEVIKNFKLLVENGDIEKVVEVKKEVKKQSQKELLAMVIDNQ